MKGKRKKGETSALHTASRPSEPPPAMLPQHPPSDPPQTRQKRHSGAISSEAPGLEAMVPSQPPFPYHFPNGNQRFLGAVPSARTSGDLQAPHSNPALSIPHPEPASHFSDCNQARGPHVYATVHQPVQSPPAVLTREKKQQACVNCRRAKLKCIIEEDSPDCIRCIARKEKCAFHPRGHDEEWQQTITQDLHATMQHLAQLSRIVHSIASHLTQAGMLPTPTVRSFRPFQVPIRDLYSQVAMDSESNVSPNERKRKRDLHDHTGQHTFGLPPTQRADSSSYRFRGPSTSSQGSATHTTAQTSRTTPALLSSTPMIRTPHTPHHIAIHHRSSVRPYIPGSGSGSHQAANPSFALPSSTPQPLLMTPEYAAVQVPDFQDPTDPTIHSKMTTSTPLVGSQSSTTGLIQSTSCPVAFRTPEEIEGNPPGNIHDSINPRSESIPPRSSVGAENVEPVESDAPLTPALDEEGEEIYGSADGRATIVTKTIVPPVAVRQLVQYFHASIAPHLFGYHLQLNHFPYLSDGPRSITPFILAVECLLASERIADLYRYHSPLADEVLQMIVTSPAESWQTFQGSRNDRTEQMYAVGDAIQREVKGDELEWDPELGIGPEEIVGVCALTSFMSERDHAKTISVHAFSWARGWANYMKAPAATFAEATGLITALRRPTESEIARIWLLAYIVAAQEVLQVGIIGAQLPSDISSWTTIILPEDPMRLAGRKGINLHDVLLCCHARLLAHMLQWLVDRHGITRADGTPEAREMYLIAHKRLADRTNSFLEWWAEDLKLYIDSEEQTRQITLDYLNARSLVNSVLAGSLVQSPSEQALWQRAKGVAVECALQILKQCQAWTPASSLINIPHVYYRMIALAAVEVVEALTALEQRMITQAACPTTVNEVIPIITSVSRIMSSEDVQQFHYSQVTSYALQQHAESLARLVKHRGCLD